ncbi:hypothetical protein DY000_02042171 [Brassica cretica]|uniref:Arabidopsis retrotransposon Orf1 C-terminal domain-containing protein n=1 Tax=Brassica cretica TaxID=69181 RepID=A0ABQ7BG02_BRACR|nr:hypothetical protein DY000_02042171 [Brassica cretica]
MSGYQPRYNQQANYQPQQTTPPGFHNKGQQPAQQQPTTSTSTPQVSSTDALLKQILESQTRSEKHVGYELKNLHSKIDGSYNELNNKFRTLENQFAAMNTQQNRQQGQEELCFINNNGSWYKKEPNFQYNNGSWYKKEPNFQYNNYQQRSYPNNQQSGYQPRYNQQANYQPQQTTPPVYICKVNRLIPFQVLYFSGTMVRKTKGKSDAERQEPESQESSLGGKALASERAGSGTQRTSRQQTVAAKKAKEQEKRAGKSIAVTTDEESGDESADEQAPTKRAKMSKGKEVAEDRDRAKTPSEEELYHHLLNVVTWTPTRFADLDLLKEVGLDSDIEAMLGHLKMPKLLTMAYPAYRDISCQFLSSLEVTYHDVPHVRQG